MPAAPTSPRVRPLEDPGYSPGPLQAMRSSTLYVVQCLIVGPRGHNLLSFGFWAAVRAALPSVVWLSQSSGVTWTVVAAGVSPASSLRARTRPAPETADGLVTAAPLRPGSLRSWVTNPALSAPTIGTSGWLAVFMASTIDESTPEV